MTTDDENEDWTGANAIEEAPIDLAGKTITEFSGSGNGH